MIFNFVKSVSPNWPNFFTFLFLRFTANKITHWNFILKCEKHMVASFLLQWWLDDWRRTFWLNRLDLKNDFALGKKDLTKDFNWKETADKKKSKEESTRETLIPDIYFLQQSTSYVRVNWRILASTDYSSKLLKF